MWFWDPCYQTKISELLNYKYGDQSEGAYGASEGPPLIQNMIKEGNILL